MSAEAPVDANGVLRSSFLTLSPERLNLDPGATAAKCAAAVPVAKKRDTFSDVQAQAQGQEAAAVKSPSFDADVISSTDTTSTSAASALANTSASPPKGTDGLRFAEGHLRRASSVGSASSVGTAGGEERMRFLKLGHALGSEKGLGDWAE